MSRNLNVVTPALAVFNLDKTLAGILNPETGQVATVGVARDFVVANGVAGTVSSRLGNGINGGQVQVVATAVAAAGILATITIPTTLEQGSSGYPNITPANAAALALTGAASVRANTVGRATGFDIVTDAIIANGTYIWNVRW